MATVGLVIDGRARVPYENHVVDWLRDVVENRPERRLEVLDVGEYRRGTLSDGDYEREHPLDRLAFETWCSRLDACHALVVLVTDARPALLSLVPGSEISHSRIGFIAYGGVLVDRRLRRARERAASRGFVVADTLVPILAPVYLDMAGHGGRLRDFDFLNEAAVALCEELLA
jgi:hypothetical protein